MSKRRRYGLADVRASYTAEKRWAEMEGDFPVFLIYRPISFWLTAPLLNLGVTPFAVTLSSVFAMAAMVVVAASGAALAYAGVAALGFVFHVLDCVDGNAARTAGLASRFGRLLDGFVDAAYWVSLFVSLGLLVEASSEGWWAEHGLELSLGLSILVLLGRLLRDSFESVFGVRAEFHAEPPTIDVAVVCRLLFYGLEHLYVFAIAIGGACGRLELVLAGIALYVSVIFLGSVAITFRAARASG